MQKAEEIYIVVGCREENLEETVKLYLIMGHPTSLEKNPTQPDPTNAMGGYGPHFMTHSNSRAGYKP